LLKEFLPAIAFTLKLRNKFLVKNSLNNVSFFDVVLKGQRLVSLTKSLLEESFQKKPSSLTVQTTAVKKMTELCVEESVRLQKVNVLIVK
jgi:hypothetical protein